ncbi:MAG TPA: hypothetical protein VIC57_16705 [Candidatus Dormibacteraeota bacterium]
MDRGLRGHARPSWTGHEERAAEVRRCLLWASAPGEGRRMSQAGIAQHAGVNQATVSRQERELRRWGVLVWLDEDGQVIPADQAPERHEGRREYRCPVREVRWTRELVEVRRERPGWRRRLDLAVALLDLPEHVRPSEALVWGCLRRNPIANGDAVLESWYAAALRRLEVQLEREELAAADAAERNRQRQREVDGERSNVDIIGDLMAVLPPRRGASQHKCIEPERGRSLHTVQGSTPNKVRAGRTRRRTVVGEEEHDQLVAGGRVPSVERSTALFAELARAGARVGERCPGSVWRGLARLAPERSLDQLVGEYGRAVVLTLECVERAALDRRPPVLNPAAFAAGVVRRALSQAA